jgi:hypothetical protein
LSYTIAVVTVLWPFVQTFLKHSSPELTNFPADSYLKYSCTTNRRCSTVYLCRGMLLYHWRTEKCNPMIAQVCYHWCWSYTPRLKTVQLGAVFGSFIPLI